MLKATRALPLLLLLPFGTFGCHRQQPPVSMTTPGVRWLAMSQPDQNQLVSAFITGYQAASFEACDFFKDNYDPRSPELHAQTNRILLDPFAVCTHKTGTFSHYDPNPTHRNRFKSYVDVLTDFYRVHPDQRNTPPEYLLLHLIEGQAVTASQLYSDPTIYFKPEQNR